MEAIVKFVLGVIVLVVGFVIINFVFPLLVIALFAIASNWFGVVGLIIAFCLVVFGIPALLGIGSEKPSDPYKPTDDAGGL